MHLFPSTMPSTTTTTSLQRKRQDLITLINHVRTLPIDQNGESSNLVLSRLLAEVRRSEVEEMRNAVLQCPGLSSDKSQALLQIALPALQEALDHINKNGDMMQSSLMSGEALTSSFCAKGGIPESVMDVAENSSNDSSSSEHEHDQQDESAIKLIKKEGRHQVAVPTLISSSKKSKASKKPKSSSTNTVRSKSKSSSSSPLARIMKAILRCIFLDLPLATTCIFLVASYASRHIFHTYWVPVMDSLTWTDERREIESTNYMRSCDISDISTLNSDDFIIDPDSTTTEEAVAITNKHGMSVFPGLLKPETAAAMREYVLRKNAALGDDAIWLISNKNRWSFAIGADDDPSVPPILQEIATNESFLKTIEGIMGEDPAMVEFTAITSGYGAGDQHWHADNDFTASTMHYGRSFVPMYSLFVPLQDTTKEMGATSACPGTHLCGDETGLSQMCDELNFQVSDSRGRLAEKEEDHVWKNGDGYLMNLNTYHRGPGHT